MPVYRRGVRSLTLVALVVALVAAVPAAAVSAPTIEVRARSRLELKSAERTSRGDLEIVGRLLDAGTGVGLAGQEVTVLVHGRTERGTTDETGEFSVTVGGMSIPTAHIVFEFEGASRADPSKLESPNVELRKRAVSLSLSLAPTATGFDLTISATSAGARVDVPVMLAAGPTDVDPTPLGSALTGTTTPITRAQLGGAGRGRVVVTFEGNNDLAPARAEVSTESKAKSVIKAALTDATVAFEDDVVVAGTVTGDDGAALARAPVSLFTGDRRLSQTIADDQGRFRLRVEAQILRAGQHPLQVAVDPSSPWIEPSRSQPMVVVIAPAEPVPVAFTVAAFAITALVAAGFFWLRARRTPPRKIVAPEEAADAPAPVVTGGLTVGRPSIADTIRRAHDHGLAGVVRDAVRHRGLQGATLRLRHASGEQLLAAGPTGEFEIDGLAPGVWQVKVSGSGHVAERFELSLPHHGELRAMKVDLIPVREQVFALYRKVAEPLLPEPRLWGVWSPRQIFQHVRALRPRPELAELTAFVEETYFSARVTEEAALEHARARVERAQAEARAAAPAATAAAAPAV